LDSTGWGVGAAQQIILEKRSLDCFECPNLGPLLGQLGADRYVVYGFATEYCVRLAALGLLGTGKRVDLVTDAIECISGEEAERTIAEFTASGGILTTVAQALS
jgi:nicotinamidase/pyrazinamidase